MDNSSGVGVVDKTVALLDAVSDGPASLADLVERTGIARPTAHRLAVALEHHGLLARDDAGRFILGTRLLQWAGEVDPLLPRAQAAVIDLRDRTQVSAQVYRRQGDGRLCIAAAEPVAGLRDNVPVGSILTMKAGSAAQVLVAWLPAADLRMALRGAVFGSTDLRDVRDRDGQVIAAVSLSGPIERLARPSRSHLTALLASARDLSDQVRPR